MINIKKRNPLELILGIKLSSKNLTNNQRVHFRITLKNQQMFHNLKKTNWHIENNVIFASTKYEFQCQIINETTFLGQIHQLDHVALTKMFPF